MRLGQLWEAKATFEKALKMDPYHQNAFQNHRDLTEYMRNAGMFV
jgi:hypothetical protein